MTDTELRLRRMSNQYLLQKEKKETVIRALCGFQAQFFSNAMHAMRIRCSDFTEAGAVDGLVRNWTLRGTMHVFAEADLPVFVNCHGGRDYCRNEWDGLSFWNSSPC